MKITAEAKEILMQIMTENNAKALLMFTQSSPCGNSLKLDLYNGDDESNIELLDGVPVLIDSETQSWTEEVTIAEANGGLTMINPNSGCGSCAGCH